MRKRLLVLMVALQLPVAGCAPIRRVETGIATALVSDADERRLGEQIHKEILQQGIRPVRDPAVQAYAEGIVDRLLPTVKRKKAVADVRVIVLDAPDQVNAFATPGGRVYVFSGLLLFAHDESEVAGVLAHEIGHLAAHHPERQLVLAYGAQTVAGLALGKDPKLLEQIAAQLVGGGLLAANSRADETEADDLALRYVHRAGWDPRGLVRFFVRLRKEEGEVPAVLGWLSTHPTTTDRIERLRGELKRRRWEGGEKGAAAHAKIQARLRGRPHPPGSRSSS